MFLGERFIVVCAVHVVQLVGQRVTVKIVGKRIAAPAQRVELLAPLRDQPVFVLCIVVSHASQSPCLRLASIKLSNPPSSTA